MSEHMELQSRDHCKIFLFQNYVDIYMRKKTGPGFICRALVDGDEGKLDYFTHNAKKSNSSIFCRICNYYLGGTTQR